MLKFVESSVTFTEIPNEITLCLNFSLCPNHCPGCSESYLAGDIGKEFTSLVLSDLIKQNPGISCIAFMGGDNDHETVYHFVNYIHKTYGLKVAMYSGRDYLDLKLASVLDYYKIGGWKQPEGDPSTWHKKRSGPMNFPWTNQIMFKRDGDNLIDITTEFQKNPVNNLEQYIIK